MGNAVGVQIPQTVAGQDLIPSMQENENTSQMHVCVLLLFWIVTHGEEYDWNTTEFLAYLPMVPAGKGFLPKYSFYVVSVIVIEHNFIWGELLNVQDSLSSIRTCINKMRVLNY